MEIYGQKGSVLIPSRDAIRVRIGDAAERVLAAPALGGNDVDQLCYLAAVVRGEIRPSAGLS